MFSGGNKFTPLPVFLKFSMNKRRIREQQLLCFFFKDPKSIKKYYVFWETNKDVI